jgi:hypothetical protein
VSNQRTVAIVQSNYIPWKGYFDLIARADDFILLDNVQYTRRDWRNRNRIKTAAGPRWLTIPVQAKGRYSQRIDETLVADAGWHDSHWSAICQAYRAAAHFAEVAAVLEPVYASLTQERLCDINATLLATLCEMLGISTRMSRSTDYPAREERSERLLDLTLAVGATEYLSGSAAQGYLDIAAFERAGVEVAWMSYEGYPEYPQLHPPFDHAVSVLDVLFNVGPDAARDYLLAPRARAGAAR